MLKKSSQSDDRRPHIGLEVAAAEVRQAAEASSPQDAFAQLAAVAGKGYGALALPICTVLQRQEDWQAHPQSPNILEALHAALKRDLPASPLLQQIGGVVIVGHIRFLDLDHTLLTGVELRQEKTDRFAFTFAGAPPIDLFAPDYSLTPLPFTGDLISSQSENKTAAFYVQDQVTILPNLKFMGGLRFDLCSSIHPSRGSG